MTKFKVGEKVNLKVAGAGVVSTESAVVGEIKGNEMWLDNGSGNDPSGPFNAETGKDMRESPFGFSLTVVKKRQVKK